MQPFKKDEHIINILSVAVLKLNSQILSNFHTHSQALVECLPLPHLFLLVRYIFNKVSLLFFISFYFIYRVCVHIHTMLQQLTCTTPLYPYYPHKESKCLFHLQHHSLVVKQNIKKQEYHVFPSSMSPCT